MRGGCYERRYDFIVRITINDGAFSHQTDARVTDSLFFVAIGLIHP